MLQKTGFGISVVTSQIEIPIPFYMRILRSCKNTYGPCRSCRIACGPAHINNMPAYRRSKRPVTRYTPYSGAMRTVARLGAKYAANKAFEFVANRFKKKPATNFVTTQYDTAKQYRYKRMPKGKRKRWVKKIKQNQAMDYAEAGTRTAVYSGNMEKSIRSGQTQGLMAVHLFANNGSEQQFYSQSWEFGQSDINYLISRDPRIITAGTQLSKFRFSSGVLDITARNSSTNNLALEVDLYVIRYTSETDFISFMGMHENAITKIGDTEGNVNPPLTLEKRGVTPFDIPALAAMGMKIVSKQKFFLPNGNTFTYQYRDPKNHGYDIGKKYDNDGFVLPGQTVSLLFSFKPVIGGTIADAKLTVGATRTYRYGIIGENTLAGMYYGQ